MLRHWQPEHYQQQQQQSLTTALLSIVTHGDEVEYSNQFD